MASDYTLDYIAGNVGANPEQRDTPNNGSVVSFSVAQAVQFGKDAPDPEWYNVAIWDAGMRQVVLKNIKKGDRVVIAGRRKPDRQHNGKTYRDFTGYRVGKVEYLFPLDRTPGQPEQARQAPDTNDDLPF